MAPARPRITCRPMREDDCNAAVRLLTSGFPERSAAYWQTGLERLGARDVPAGCPRYGYVLANGSALHGIALLIFSEENGGQKRANVSSWFVEPAYRSFSNALLAPAFRRKDVTFFNISPRPNTVETIVAQGFAPYVEGTFQALTMFGPALPGASVRTITDETTDAAPFLARHAAYGCLCFEVAIGTERLPFIFLPRRLARERLHGAQLIYAPNTASFVRCAGLLGRQLLRRRLAIVVLDADEPVPGLVGRYRTGHRAKYYRGPTPPPINDLRDSELVLFGP